MKHLFVVAATLAPCIAMADDSMCKSRSDFARQLMDARLEGVQLDRVLSSIEGGSGSDEVKQDMRRLALAAYKTPGYQTKSAKARAITEFGNEAMLSCIEGKSRP